MALLAWDFRSDVLEFQVGYSGLGQLSPLRVRLSILTQTSVKLSLVPNHHHDPMFCILYLGLEVFLVSVQSLMLESPPGDFQYYYLLGPALKIGEFLFFLLVSRVLLELQVLAFECLRLVVYDFIAHQFSQFARELLDLCCCLPVLHEHRNLSCLLHLMREQFYLFHPVRLL
jgi:hypothetical protein